jgi:multidrug efflux pump subunit AcrB
MQRFNLSAWSVRHPTLILFLMMLIAVGGIFSYIKLGRAEDPSFTIKVAVVTAAWPGATAQQVQDQVAEPIEKKLQELPYFDKVQTYSKPGFVALQVSMKDTTPPSEVANQFYILRRKLTDIRASLPPDLIGPNVNDEFGDVDSVLYAVTGDGASYRQLKDTAQGLRSDLLRVADVTKVNIYGAQNERIFVDFNHAKIASLGISPAQIFQSLVKQNAISPAGNIDTEAQSIPMRVTGQFQTEEDVANTPVNVNGKDFRLGDIANVHHGYEDPGSYFIRQKGKAALLVGVVMRKGGNVLDLGEHLNAKIDEFKAGLPVGLDIEQIADQPKVVTRAVGEFTRSFAEALAIVLLVSFVSLGWRTGIVVALSVPLVLAAVFMLMNAMGMDLQRVTLGALIIALGLLVDDAIIAVEMMVVKMEQGWDRMRAAGFAWESTAFPMLTGTLVTASGFIPVGFAASSVGEYTNGIFWVVALSLLVSWVVAVVFTPYLGVKLLPNFKSHGHSEHDIYNTRIYRAFRAVVAWCVQHRYITVATTFAIFVISIAAFGLVQQQFFPLSDRPELFVQMRLPEGTSIGATSDVAASAEKLLAGDEDIATYTTYIGQGSPRFWLGLNLQLPNPAYAEIVIVSKDLEARERIKSRLQKLVDDGALSSARVRIDRFTFGPPVGYPVQFRVVGRDEQKVRDIAYQVRDIMRENKNVVEPHLDWNEKSPAVTLEVDQSRARALGLTPQDISQSLQTLLSGYTVTSLRDGTELIDVVARADQSERKALDQISDLSVTSKDGIVVPLSQIAKLHYGSEDPILWRRNRDSTITVRSDVVDGVQAPDVTNQILPKLQSLKEGLPSGYRIDTGGAVEESAKGNSSLFAVFPFMLAAMLLVLMLQLQSFSQLFMVLLTAPLGIIGASLGLNLAGRPFGFVALLGLIALAGMIMRNTVILIDQIERDAKSGESSLVDAIIGSTVRRARPVVLTALAAILAMIPLSESLFWGPMAVTIMAGLFVATFLTLLFVPALYALWNRKALKAESLAGHSHKALNVPVVPTIQMAAE